MSKKKLLWHHVAMVYDRDGITLYHNGSQVPIDALRNLFERAKVSIRYAEWVREPDMRGKTSEKEQKAKKTKRSNPKNKTQE